MARLETPFKSTITSGNVLSLNTPTNKKALMSYYTSTTQQPLPVSPAISLIILLEYRLNTVKTSTSSVGLNHNVDDDDCCIGVVHNLGHQVEHCFTAKS